MAVELNFSKISDGRYEAIVQIDSDVKLQVLFPEGEIGSVMVHQSLDGAHWDVLEDKSRYGNYPVLRTDGVSKGDYVKFVADKEPESYICKVIE